MLSCARISWTTMGELVSGLRAFISACVCVVCGERARREK